MLGAIAGDVIGSVHEIEATKTKQFELFVPDSTFTDDTVMSVAVAEALLNGSEYAKTFHRYYHFYPDAGYGKTFKVWCETRSTTPYNSWGNGSAMRVSPVAWAFNSIEEVIAEAERSAAVTHNHPEGIRGAQATAAAIFLARTQHSKDEIADTITQRFGYDLTQSLNSVRREFLFDVSCQGTVPWAIRAFVEADDFEDAIRNAISLGGDADTLAAIAGSIAEPFFGIPESIQVEVKRRLDDRLRDVLERFRQRYVVE